MSNDPAELLERARVARSAGRRTEARDLTDRALLAVLEDAQARVDAAALALEEATAARLQAMHDARDHGWTYARIGAPVGLTMQRIHQIMNGEQR